MESQAVILDFIHRNPHNTLLPAEASHQQLSSEGISVALTVYGTIASEYAALGIPVVTASTVAPTVRYNFNIHAQSVDHYEAILLDPEKWQVSINRTEVYEHYYMQHGHANGEWLFPDYVQMEEVLGGPVNAEVNQQIYDYWVSQCWSDELHKKVLQRVQNFVKSKDYLLVPDK